MPALLIVDASLSTRLATELKSRGMAARSVAQMGHKKLLDPDLLPALDADLAGTVWTLVTADDAMPAAHGRLIAELGITVATVDPRWERTGLEQEHHKRDVVHRWAHAMAEQPRSTARRYSRGGHRVWRPLRR